MCVDHWVKLRPKERCHLKVNALNSFSFFLFLNKELKWSGFLKTTAKTKPSQVEYAYNDVGGGGGGEERERPRGMRLVKTTQLRSTRFPLLSNE